MYASKLVGRPSGLCGSGLRLQTVQGGRWGAVRRRLNQAAVLGVQAAVPIPASEEVMRHEQCVRQQAERRAWPQPRRGAAGRWRWRRWVRGWCACARVFCPRRCPRRGGSVPHPTPKRLTDHRQMCCGPEALPHRLRVARDPDDARLPEMDLRLVHCRHLHRTPHTQTRRCAQALGVREGGCKAAARGPEAARTSLRLKTVG